MTLPPASSHDFFMEMLTQAPSEIVHGVPPVATGAATGFGLAVVVFDVVVVVVVVGAAVVVVVVGAAVVVVVVVAEDCAATRSGLATGVPVPVAHADSVAMPATVAPTINCF